MDIMHLIKTMISVILMIGCVSGYKGGYGSESGGGFGGMGEMGPPKPYGFGYNAADEQGGNHYRKEQGDGSGSVSGSYGYSDNKGLYRVVDYIANAEGFQAKVKTNEPGTDGKENPAHVNMQANLSPAGIQEGLGGGNFGFNGKGAGGGETMFW